MKQKPLIKTLAGLVLVPVLLVLFVAGCQNALIFHPDKHPIGLWDTGNIPLPIEDVGFEAEDGTPLHGWWVPREGAMATVLFFHGNGGNLSQRLENVFLLYHLNLNIFIFDYRGYGKSEGDPDEEGVRLDSQAAYDWLIQMRNISPESLILFGRSLGGVFAAYTASKNEVAGLILESTFTNAQEMADELFTVLPVGWFLSAELDTRSYVSHLNRPKLFIHGTADGMIPYTMGRKLYIGAPEPKEFYSIVGGRHNNSFRIGGRPYFDKIREFIARAVKAQNPRVPQTHTDIQEE